MIPIFQGKVVEGRLKLEKIQEFKSYLAKLEGKVIEVVVRKISWKRSAPQNRYYWGVIVKMVSDEMGIIPEEAHGLLKGLFLKIGTSYKGRRYEYVKSTTTLSVPEFEAYLEKSRLWANSELMLQIPLPNEVEL